MAMRRRSIELNSGHKTLLSNDLGAAAGLMFEIGKRRCFIGASDAAGSRRELVG